MNKSGISFVGGNLGKMLTIDLLKKRGLNMCFLCTNEEKSLDHFLLCCTKTSILWRLVFSLFRVELVLPPSVKEALLGWQGSFVWRKEESVKGCPLMHFSDCLERANRSCAKSLFLVFIFGVGYGGIKWSNNVYGRLHWLCGVTHGWGLLFFWISFSCFDLAFDVFVYYPCTLIRSCS